MKNIHGNVMAFSLLRSCLDRTCEDNKSLMSRENYYFSEDDLGMFNADRVRDTLFNISTLH